MILEFADERIALLIGAGTGASLAAVAGARWLGPYGIALGACEHVCV
jgi:hypothetical protein